MTIDARPDVPPQADAVLNEFDFYRCHECTRLITNPELTLALATTGEPCPCGSSHLRPTNLPWWGWLLPRVWHFALCRWRGLDNQTAATWWGWWLSHIPTSQAPQPRRPACIRRREL